MNARGFTLLEALLAAAIITLLAALAAARLGPGGRTETQTLAVQAMRDLFALAPELARAHAQELQLAYRQGGVRLELPDGTPVASVAPVPVPARLEPNFAEGPLYRVRPTGRLEPFPGTPSPLWLRAGRLYYVLDVGASGATRITYTPTPP